MSLNHAQAAVPRPSAALGVGVIAKPLFGLFYAPNFQLQQFSIEQCVFPLHLRIKTILYVNYHKTMSCQEKERPKENEIAIQKDLQ